MADHHQRAGIILEVILEPQGRFEIEMVRRFVEEQHVGFGEQQGAERDAHLPTARVTVERLRLHLLVKPQAEQDPCRLCGRTPGIDRQQALMEIAQAVGVGAMLGFVHQKRALLIGG